MKKRNVLRRLNINKLTIILIMLTIILAGINSCYADSRNEITGEWSGRLWFENPKGEWSDYEFQSLSVSGTVAEKTDPDGRPEFEIQLFNKYFSETVPIVISDADLTDGVYRCISGYVMSYELHEWGMEIELDEESPDSLRTTVIIKKPGDYGHVFTPEVPERPLPETLKVLRLKGTCRDADGGFDYLIELVPSESENSLCS